MGLNNSIFDEIEKKIANHADKHFYRLDQGKLSDYDMPYAQLSPPGGQVQLKSAVIRYYTMRFNQSLSDQQLLLTAGISHGLGLLFQTLLSPGDEVLILAPCWPLLKGIVEHARTVAVEVPYFGEVGEHGASSLIEQLERYRSSRSKAIYLNSPNNPTGISVNASTMRALVEYAQAHDLFVIADNAYELYDFSAEGFCDPFLLTGYDKCVSLYSFSKSLNAPGYRIGFMTVSPRWHSQLYKASLYTVYSLCTISQVFIADELTKLTPERLAAQRRRVNQARTYAMDHLLVPHVSAEGGYYLWLDFSGLLARFGTMTAIYAFLFDKGISLTPGQAFGSRFNNCARLCYTSVDLIQLKQAIRLINRICG